MGLASNLGDEQSVPMSPMGSLIYMAPELLAQKVGGRHTDWWAVGILAYELMTGRSPWSSIEDKRKIRAEIQSTLEKPVLPPRRLSFAGNKLIRSLLQHQVDKRLGSKSDLELNEAPFFKTIDWVETEAQRSSPAFVPDTKCLDTDTCDRALEVYLSREAEEAEAGNGDSDADAWYFGLPTLDSRPRWGDA